MINAFLPLLMEAATPRIVNVTSKRGSIGEEGAWAGSPPWCTRARRPR